MLSIKPGVKINGLKPEMQLGIQIVSKVFHEKLNEDCTITEITGGKHRRASQHLSGNAVDFRTRELTPTQKGFLEDKSREALGENYDVVLHTTHLHVEYQPK